MQDGTIMNIIKNTDAQLIENLLPQESFQVLLTKIAALHIKTKLDFFSHQKAEGIQTTV